MIPLFVIPLFAVVGFFFVAVSFATWSRPAALGFRGTRDTWQTTRGVLFGLWTLALPAYSLWEWYSLAQPPANLAVYQYEHKVWSDVWTAVTVVLGVLFGIKK